VFLAPVLALAAWQPLPAVPDLGYNSVAGVRVGHHAVFVAGGTYAATRVKALAYDLEAERWRPVPRSPLHWRSGHVTLAAGRRVIVWGGASNAGHHRDGAVLEGNRWRRMAEAPIHGFQRPAVWTGREMIVAAGAAYDPATDRWRRIRPAPFQARAAVWTGRRMLIAGAREAAAYEPETNRWRILAPPPIDTPVAVWTGRRMLVFDGNDGAAYDPGRDRWRSLGRAPLRDRYDFTAVWDGTRLLIWGGVGVERGDAYLNDGAAYDHGWQPLPASPLRRRDRHAAVAIPGHGMVVWGGWGAGPRSDGAILSSRARRSASPDPPRRAARCPARRARAPR
jgi:hypothetical protein